ncbi:MAG: D-sedoheptulose 7-phosphate isomerase [Bacteroidales bacterium]|jgi:D-sedoheptulose 7-phosphate isomerase|nr:D-sedoheptulose 7-phosphate isomerase [Bacteroidales bacterium]MBR4177400.1 D-sedoheptulose 7-phosphate isomerase [Bacteroidales bacterium]
MNPRISESIAQSIAAKQDILTDGDFLARIEKAADMITASLKGGGKIHFCGNGGSAADAQHLAAELSGRFYYDRPPLNAEALHCNSSYLTAVGNDYGYEHIFARLMRGTGHKGDVLVGISTSGNSKNILYAYDVCKELGISIISMTGATGGKMKEASDLLLNVPSTDTPRIQESHIMIGHIICELVESAIFPKKV